MAKLVRQDDAVTTYRYVRLGLFALVVFLAASVINTWRHADGWQNSISAYFYTSSHSVFVGSLCAVGICLIVYQGSTTTEDSLLNFAGFLAFIVGLVPTRREELRGPGLPDDFRPTAFVENNVGALLFASVAAAVVLVLIRFIRNRMDTPPQATLCTAQQDTPEDNSKASPAPLAAIVRLLKRALPGVAPILHCLARLLPFLLLLALIAGAVVFVVDLPLFVENAHGIAAYTMFGAIIVVVLHYACYAALRKDRGPRTRLGFVVAYLIIAVVMVLTLIIVAVFQFTGNGLGVLVVEFLVIGEFAVFWLFQSVDLWELETYQVPTLSELLEDLTVDPAQSSR
jgi:vacuolar-type H+-ATPase subunit I/STV1